MALNKTILEQELSKIMDNDNVGFFGFSGDSSVIANRWADAIGIYAASIIPTTTTLAVAKELFNAALLDMSVGTGKELFVTAFVNYAVSLVPGMLPAFIGTPPAVPINFDLLYAFPINTSVETKVDVMASIIHTWFKTGLAVPSGGGSPINWN